MATSCRWKLQSEHINVLQTCAYLLSFRWRLRRASSIGTRYVHLVDSMVTMNAMAKGRSSSQRLRKVLLRINALDLAGRLAPALAYVRSHRNPADKPSRAFAKSAANERTNRLYQKSSSYHTARRQRQIK